MGYENDSTTSSSSDTAVSDTEIEGAPDARAARGDTGALQLTEMEEARVNAPLSAGADPKLRQRRRMSMMQRLDQRKRLAEANAGRREVEVAVVEQRVSNLAQGCLCEPPSSLYRLKPLLMP